jgi:hypothetical protein
MCLRRAPEKYIAGAALDRAGLDNVGSLTHHNPADLRLKCSSYIKEACRDFSGEPNLLKLIREIIGPPLGSSGQGSWPQIQRSGFDSRRYQIFREVVGLERGPLSLGKYN